MVKFKSPFIILTCAMKRTDPPSPVRLVASHVTAIHTNSYGADVWDISGQAHAVREAPEDVDAAVTERLGRLALVPPIVPGMEDSK